MATRKVLTFAAILCSFALQSWAQEGEDQGNPNQVYGALREAPLNPDKGPPEAYLYENVDGIFILGEQGSGGSAKYKWGPNREENKDKLVFKSRLFIDGSGRADTPAKVVVFVYEATDDKGNSWYLMFGEDPLVGRTGAGGRKLYPIYYSFKDPSDQTAIIKRWLTIGGTRRR